MRVLSFRAAVRKMEEERFHKESGWLDHMRRNASQALADRILRGASRYTRIDPPGGSDESFSEVIHQWTIGIEENMDAIAEREEQMAEARREGREEAAGMLEAAAAKFESVDGPCKFALLNLLREQARRIRAMDHSVSSPT